MSKVLKIGITLTLFFLLVLVRAFENHLFYDPLLLYFKGSHLTEAFPALNFVKLIISYSFRFLLNASISILILKVCFDKQVVLKPLLWFYGLSFLALSLVFFLFVFFEVQVGNLILFYIRRFIIQPIFILVLFPLFYLLKKGYSFSS